MPLTASIKASLRQSWLSPRFLAIKYIQEALIECAPDVRGKVLDIGCGLMPYRKYFTGATSYIGIDRHHAAGRSEPDLVGETPPLPFLDHSFDVVIATEVLEHVAHPDGLIQECRRILKPAGRLIISVPLIEPVHEAPRDFSRFTSFGLKELLESNGFRVATVWTKGGWCSVAAAMFSKGLYDLANPEANRDADQDRRAIAAIVLPFCAAAQLAGYAVDRLVTSRTWTLGYIVLAIRV